ncbi:PadR family transcriptional regulator [Arthrobacter gengyunqii]|uniref:PadR family transcriptional regulator n=1 Tax=Arthrobacter gengyunqii TaxID=2886940 RepID=A0A9X1M0F2_9MICC|nr:helix-turn-helix transcriptional regulator [Arthrobacter gengyunqii]MCC3268640.1 PadR family transcriptional regulator [Arthrobacter gengyunqii]UOY96027.1 PadR family transcriptional regulator [Arthrobacter gengyunqii]
MAHPGEEQEWVEARVESWVETYKKSMLTPVVLRAVAERQPVTVASVAAAVAASTGWQITERSLYRTLKRLQDSGLLHSAEVDVPRTGAKRKEISLTGLGAQFLAGITASLVEFPVPESGGAGAKRSVPE